jgi:hypothetical protein
MDKLTKRERSVLMSRIRSKDSKPELIVRRTAHRMGFRYRPIIVTLQRGIAVAEGLSNNVGLGDRIDIFEIEQFVALNLYELGKFGADGRKIAVMEMVDRYNEIVEEFETDPSLKIELRR